MITTSTTSITAITRHVYYYYYNYCNYCVVMWIKSLVSTELSERCDCLLLQQSLDLLITTPTTNITTTTTNTTSTELLLLQVLCICVDKVTSEHRAIRALRSSVTTTDPRYNDWYNLLSAPGLPMSRAYWREHGTMLRLQLRLLYLLQDDLSWNFTMPSACRSVAVVVVEVVFYTVSPKTSHFLFVHLFAKC